MASRRILRHSYHTSPTKQNNTKVYESFSLVEVYQAWVNCRLSELQQSIGDLSTDLCDGLILCKLVELTSGTCLDVTTKVEDKNVRIQNVQKVFDFLESQGVQISPHNPQDVVQGNFRAVLDILWHLILHFEIHVSSQQPSQRTVPLGKRSLLEWLSTELPELNINPKSHFSDAFQDGLVIVKLLNKYCIFKSRDVGVKGLSVINLAFAMKTAEQQLGIPAGIFSPQDMVNRTADEHSIMIYIALIRRRINQMKDGELVLCQSPVKWTYVSPKGLIRTSHKEGEKLPALLEQDSSPRMSPENAEDLSKDNKLDQTSNNETPGQEGSDVVERTLETSVDTDKSVTKVTQEMSDVSSSSDASSAEGHANKNVENSQGVYVNGITSSSRTDVTEQHDQTVSSSVESSEHLVVEKQLNSLSEGGSVSENHHADHIQIEVEKTEISKSVTDTQEVTTDAKHVETHKINGHHALNGPETDLQDTEGGSDVNAKSGVIEDADAIGVIRNETGNTDGDKNETDDTCTEDEESFTSSTISFSLSEDIEHAETGSEPQSSTPLLGTEEVVLQVNGHVDAKSDDQSLEGGPPGHKNRPTSLHTPPPLKDLSAVCLNGDVSMADSLSPSKMQPCTSLSPNTLNKLVEQQARSHAALQVLQAQIQSTPIDALTPKLPKESISSALMQNLSYNDHELTESLKGLLHDMQNDPKFTGLGVVHSTPIAPSLSFDLDVVDSDDDEVDQSFNELMDMAREIGYETPAATTPARQFMSPQTVLHNGHGNALPLPGHHFVQEAAQRTDAEVVNSPSKREAMSVGVQTDPSIYAGTVYNHDEALQNFSYIIVDDSTGTSHAIVQTHECYGGFQKDLSPIESEHLSKHVLAKPSDMEMRLRMKMGYKVDLPSGPGSKASSEAGDSDRTISENVSEHEDAADEELVRKPCRRELVFEAGMQDDQRGVPPSPQQPMSSQVSESSSNASLKSTESDELMQYLDNIEQEAHLLKLYVEEARLEILRNLRRSIEEHFDGTPIEEIPQNLQNDWIKMVSDMVEKEVEKLELASRTREADIKIQDMEMISKMRNELDVVATENFQLQEEVNRLRHLEGQNIILRDRVVTLEQNVKKLEDEGDKKEGETCALKKKIKLLEEEIVGLKSDYQFKLEDTECENEGLMKEYVHLEEENKELQETVAALKHELRRSEVLRRDGEKSKVQSVSALTEELGDLRRRLQDAENNSVALRTAANADQIVSKCLEERVEDLEKLLAQAQDKHSKAVNDVFMYQMQLSEAETALMKHKHEAEDLRHQNTFLKVSLEIAEDARKKTEERLHMKTKARENKWGVWEELKLLEKRIKDMQKEKKSLDNSFLHFRVEQEELNKSMETFRMRGISRSSRNSSTSQEDDVKQELDSTLNVSESHEENQENDTSLDNSFSISKQVDAISNGWQQTETSHTETKTPTDTKTHDNHTPEAEVFVNHAE